MMPFSKIYSKKTSKSSTPGGFGALDWNRTSGPQSRSDQAVKGESPKTLGFVQSAQKQQYIGPVPGVQETVGFRLFY